MIVRFKKKIAEPLLKNYVKFRSSIYGRVIFVIAILSVVLLLSFGVIFRSVYGEYLKTVIRQNGNNVGSIVEGALYHSMLENNKSALQNTLDVINTMSGIDEVNMYDRNNNLVYTSFSEGDNMHSNPNCISCHDDLATMFPAKEKAYRIIDLKTGCNMTMNDEKHRHLLIRSPILNEPSCYTSACHAHSQEEEVLGSLIIKAPLDDLDSAVGKSSTEFFLLSVLATIVLMAFLMFFTKRKIQRPLSRLIDASVAVANGNHTTRLELNSNQLDDMFMVSKAFNNMLDKLQAATTELENWSQQLEYKVQKKSEELSSAQNELIHIERIASLGKLSASVAHELNNPLSGILVYTKLIMKQMADEKQYPAKREGILKHLTFIESETKRCGDIVKGLLEFSKKDQDNFEDFFLHTILQETCKIVNHAIKLANVNFITDFQATADLIHCNQAQIKQACIAILVNATEAVAENGEIIMRTSNGVKGSVVLEIIDNGIGISSEDLVHVFEPFFSTKHQTSGIGLGLAIVHGIIQNNNGKIEIISELHKGTNVRITFPLKNELKS
ncbi:MAG: sensor histidine kinase [Prolixibacteraceae bacterium]